MSKSKKFMLRAIPVLLLVVVLISSPVFGFGNFTDMDALNDNLNNVQEGGNQSEALNKTIGGVWNTVVTVLQIAAVGAIIFAGVRYMFASASDKANIKNQLIILAVGAILVFGASTVVKLLMTATTELTGGEV